MLMRIWRKGNIYALLVKMSITTPIMQKRMKNSKKIKNPNKKSALKSRNSN
jgi:hypothetical protein